MTRLLAVAVLMLVAMITAACGGDEDNELVIMTHDSFDISEEVIAAFEAEKRAKRV